MSSETYRDSGAPVQYDADGQPMSMFYPSAKYKISWRQRLRWARLALRGEVCWVIWNFPHPETDQPSSVTIAGFQVQR